MNLLAHLMQNLTFNRTLQVLFHSAEDMDMKSRNPFEIWIVLFLMLVTPFSGLSPSMFGVDEPIEDSMAHNREQSVNARAQTIWAGTVSVTTSYTISVFDELVISPCTQVEMGSGA